MKCYVLSGVLGIIIGTLALIVEHDLIRPYIRHATFLSSMSRGTLLADVLRIYTLLIPLLFLGVFSWIVYKKHFKIWERANKLWCIYFFLIGYSIGWYLVAFRFWGVRFLGFFYFFPYIGIAFVSAFPMFFTDYISRTFVGWFFLLITLSIGYFVTTDIKNLFKRILAIIFLAVLTMWPFFQVIVWIAGD